MNRTKPAPANMANYKPPTCETCFADMEPETKYYMREEGEGKLYAHVHVTDCSGSEAP